MAFNVSWKLTIVAILLVLTMWPACEATTREVLEALMVERHETWMAQHGRTYKDSAEKAQRLKIFKDNVERIESFNKAGGRTYKLGVNKFADLTKEEILASRTGYKMSSSSRRYTTSFRYANVTQVPYSVDWREMGAVVGVKDQLQCNSCWAFSSVAAIEGNYQIKTGKLISLSEQELVDCEKIDRGCSKGGFMDRAFDFIIANGGITEESQYPYLGSDEACNRMKRLSPAVTIVGYEYVPTNSESALLKAVANQPVSVGISIAGNFESYASGVYTGEYCGTQITHAVTVVGYGTTSDGIKYWLLKNSWGETWGENGYMRLQRDVDAVEGACGIAIVPLYPTV